MFWRAARVGARRSAHHRRAGPAARCRRRRSGSRELTRRPARLPAVRRRRRRRLAYDASDDEAVDFIAGRDALLPDLRRRHAVECSSQSPGIGAARLSLRRTARSAVRAEPRARATSRRIMAGSRSPAASRTTTTVETYLAAGRRPARWRRWNYAGAIRPICSMWRVRRPDSRGRSWGAGSSGVRVAPAVPPRARRTRDRHRGRSTAAADARRRRRARSGGRVASTKRWGGVDRCRRGNASVQCRARPRTAHAAGNPARRDRAGAAAVRIGRGAASDRWQPDRGDR